MTSIVVGTYTTLPHHVTKRRPLRRVPAVAQFFRKHSNSAGITLTSWPSSVAPPLKHCHHISPPSYDSEELAGILLILERNLENLENCRSLKPISGSNVGVSLFGFSTRLKIISSPVHKLIGSAFSPASAWDLHSYPLTQLRLASSWSTATSRSWVVSILPLNRCTSLNLAGSTRATVYNVVPYTNKNRHRSSHHLVLLL